MTSTAPRSGSPSELWMHGPWRDGALSLLWVPFSVAATMAGGRPDLLALVVAATLLTSLVHQPLTLAMIYGDPEQFAIARRVFVVFPFVLLGSIVAGRLISLALVGVIAGLWNSQHTLMQRFGITRIYARKAGDRTEAAEKPMLLCWLVFALAFAAADPRTPRLLQSVDLGATNEQGVEVLQALRPYATVAVVAAALAVLWFTRLWWQHEHHLGIQGFTPKRRYLLATAVLFAVIVINPIVGLMGYVGSHAVEYMFVVQGALRRRYSGPDPRTGGVVGIAVRSPLRATGCVVAYILVVGAGLVAVQTSVQADIASVALLTIGGMHVYFDGFIWKLRRPVVAGSVAAGGTSLAIPVPALSS